MIRLNLRREPCRLALGHGVTVTVLPPTSALMMIARREAADSLAEHEAERVTKLIKAVARLAIVAWEGVGDAEGKPAEPTPDNIDALLDLYPIAEAFERDYLGPVFLLDAEKNGYAPSPTGTSAGAHATATPADQTAPSAPTS